MSPAMLVSRSKMEPMAGRGIRRTIVAVAWICLGSSLVPAAETASPSPWRYQAYLDTGFVLSRNDPASRWRMNMSRRMCWTRGCP